MVSNISRNTKQICSSRNNLIRGDEVGKLNNRGFGMSTMLVFIVLFIIVLIAIMVLAYNNGIEKDSPNPALEKKNGIFVSPKDNEEKEEE